MLVLMACHLPLFNSSNVCLWSILGMLKQLPKSKPFPLGIFCGKSKPLSVTEYFHDFVLEMKELETSGISIDGKICSLPLVLEAVICDAPARAFIKCSKTHSGFYASKRVSGIRK